MVAVRKIVHRVYLRALTGNTAPRMPHGSGVKRCKTNNMTAILVYGLCIMATGVTSILSRIK